MPRKAATKSACLIVAALSALAPSRARATEFEVQANTAFSAYEVTDPWGNIVLDRRRLMQTIGLGVENLQGTYHPGEASFRVVLMMRLDADFGVNAGLPASQAGGETTFATPAGNGVRFVPGLSSYLLDLMYGYVEGRNIAHGLLGFRLGRQYMTDVLGWWSFDGALVRLTTPYFLRLEAYGGLEQRGGLPLSSNRFEQQGIWRGSHVGFGNAAGEPSLVDYPSYNFAEPAPALGFAVESNGPSWIHARVSYRRVYNTGPSITTQFPEPGGGGYHTIDGVRISQDRLGFAADVLKSDLGAVKGGVVYDLYNQLFSRYYASAEAYIAKRATIGADFETFVPTFDADSIWNWFTHGPMTTITGRVSARVTKRFNVSASGGARLWYTEGDPTPTTGGLSKFGAGECAAAQQRTSVKLDCSLGRVTYDPSIDMVVAPAIAFAQDPANRATMTTLDGLGNLDARYRFGFGDVSMRGMFEAGARGSREGADLATEMRWDGGRFTTGARVSLYGFYDPTRPDRSAISFGYVLAGGFRPARVADFRVEWEHDTSRLVGERYRVVGLVNVKVPQ